MVSYSAPSISHYAIQCSLHISLRYTVLPSYLTTLYSAPPYLTTLYSAPPYLTTLYSTPSISHYAIQCSSISHYAIQCFPHISLRCGSQNLDLWHRIPYLTHGSVKFGHIAPKHSYISHKTWDFVRYGESTLYIQ